MGWSNVLRRDSPSRFVLLFCGLESGHVAIWQLSEQQQTNNLTLTYAALLEPNATEPTISSVNGTKKPGSMSNGLHNSKTDSPYRSPHNSISAMAWLSLSDTAGILALGSSHGHVSLISISLTGNELAPLLAYTKQESPHLVSNGARIHHIALYQQHNEHRLFFAQMDSIVIATLNISSTGYNTSCSQFTIKTVNEYALNSSVLTHFLSDTQDLYLICRDGFIHKQVTQTFNDPHHHHHQQHATRFEQFCQLLPAGSYTKQNSKRNIFQISSIPRLLSNTSHILMNLFFRTLTFNITLFFFFSLNRQRLSSSWYNSNTLHCINHET